MKMKLLWNQGGLKIVTNIIRWIFILALPVLFITASLTWGFNSLWLYEWGFQKYHVSQSTGISETDLNKTGKALVNYFNSGDEYIQVTVTKDGQSIALFNQEEQIHFKDVKQLVWLNYGVGLIALIIVLAYALTAMFWKQGRYRRLLSRSLIWGSGVSIVLILILGIASLLDFDRLFLDFHYLAFTNSFWSAEGYMLLLFPGGFWSDAALICIAFMAGLAVVAGVGAAIYLRLEKSRRY
jgi:integral membrane protein (TIGR01906 family)